MRTTKPNTILTTSSIFIVVFMIGLYSFVYFHPDLLVDRMKEQLQIVVEMTPDHNLSSEKVTAQFKEIDEVRPASVRWVPSEQAEREMRYEMGPLVNNLKGQSPFRDMVVFTVSAEYYNGLSLEMLKQKIKKLTGVDGVFYQEKVASQLESAVQSWSRVLLYGGALFLLIALILIYNTLRLSLFADRSSIMTLDLMGARKAFIKKPYLLKSARNGFWIGLMVIAVLTVLLLWLSKNYPDIWDLFYERSFILWAAAVLIFSVLFNVISTWIILTAFLKGRLQYM